jgi:hypothetical protein
MKRTTKRYTITTSAVNNYGYRVLSAGVDFTQFNNNPIMLWMHHRADGGNKNQILPIGRIVEIRLEGDAWTGQPEFDETDDFAMQVFNKYEAGILNMLSLGAQPLEISEDPKDMLPGQFNPTIKRCKVLDVSCVDRGGNDEALPVQLFDASGQPIALTKTSVSAAYLQLAASGKGQQFAANSHKQATIDVVNNAVAAGKMTDVMAVAFLANPTDEQSVNDIMENVKRAKINPDRLNGKVPKAIMPLVTKSWHELKSQPGDGNKMLKEHAPEVYKAKFFEHHGRLPAERNGKPL